MSFPFARDDNSERKWFHEMPTNPSHIDQRHVVLPSVSRTKAELPGTKGRLNYVDNHSSNYRQSFMPVYTTSNAAINSHEAQCDADCSNPRNGYANDDGRLWGVCTQRLHEVTGELMSCKQRLRTACKVVETRDATILALQEKVSTLEMRAAEDAILGSERSRQIKLLDRCISLENQVEEMNKFFDDYGLTFVGDCGHGEVLTPSEGRHFVNFTKLLNRVAELNLHVREGESQIVVNKQGAGFKTLESVPFTIYSNGIILFSGPFRNFQDPSTQVFIRDILDGFFPSELQRAYPDGVPFKVVDKREVVYEDARLRRRVFGGAGYALGRSSAKHPLTSMIEGGPQIESLTSGATSQPELPGVFKEKLALPRNDPTGTEKDVDNTPQQDSNRKRKMVRRVESQMNARQLTGDEFLKKLPPAVVRNGRLIPIREAVAEYCKNPPKIVPPCTTLRSGDSNKEQIQLKIRSEDGSAIFLVHISPERRVEDLRTCLGSGWRNRASFDLLLRSESARYDVIGEGCRLEDCGLDRNSVLHLRPRAENNTS